MSRALFNLLIDAAAAALITAMVGTGYILWFVLPPGTNRTHELWGLLRHQWGAVHGWLSVLLLAVLAVHVALHWRWLVAGLTKRLGLEAWAQRAPARAGLAVLAIAALPLATLAVASRLSVRPLATPLHGIGSAPAIRAAEVLTERCAGCHGAEQPAGGVRADSLDALRAEQHGVRWVAPGEPDASRLFAVVGASTTTRPIAPKHQLPAGEIEALRAWIASLRGRGG